MRKTCSVGQETRSFFASKLCACVKSGTYPTSALCSCQTVKRAKTTMRKLHTFLGRTVRDIERQLVAKEQQRVPFSWFLYRAKTILEQRSCQKGRKIYSLHAPEVECIGKGKAHKRYEFGVKVFIVTTIIRSKGGQFALHVCALPGNPYDDHTMASVIPQMEQSIGLSIA